jgi:coenzyme F420 hydrogenase subunit beta
MEMSGEGYLRPNINSTLDDEELSNFTATCPGVSITQEVHAAKEQMHPIWGAIISSQTGYACDTQLRQQGSSGGVISGLVNYLLNTSKVDFIAQNAVDPNDPLGNEVQQSRTKADILRAAGSRYAPAAPLRRIREMLDSGQRFAFVGKPCDVAALRAYARQDERVNKQVPYMLSFMCAGVPSRAGTVAVLKHLGVQSDEVSTFRYRGDGWPGKARAVTHNGDVREMDYATSWGEILNRHLQFRCKICPDGTGEFADIVCADAWYGKDGYPDFEERAGRSLVLGRTTQGQTLIESAVADGAIAIEKLDIAEIARMQPYQVHRKQVVLGRLMATRLALGQAPAYHGLGLIKASFGSRPIEWLRNAAGTYRRAKGESA